MSTTLASPPNLSPEAQAEQLFRYIAQGATLGDLLFDFDAQGYEMLYALGHRLYLQRRFADAAELFGFLAVHKCRERRYVKAYAAVLQMTQDHAGAIALYTLAAMMDMTDPEPCLHTCECLIAMGRIDEATEGLAMVVRQCEGDASHARLCERAQALMELLARPPAPTVQEDKQ